LHADWRLVQEYELTPGFFAMSHGWSSGKQGAALAKPVAAKGAPEAIFDLCHLDAQKTEAWMQAVHRMAREGLRVIAVAKGAYKGDEWPTNQHDLEFSPVGLIGFADPLRPGVSKAIAVCRAAGIRVAMITGDYPETALRIAEQAGLNIDDGVLTGADLIAMNASDLRKRITNTHVFARVIPEQKLRLVQALKANGEVVAMTGDGVNDAPALKAAHVGVAMGKRGTDVAREAASIVLLEDDFESIVTAIALGRRIYSNLRKAMAYILAVHIPIAGLALLPLLFGLPPILFPVHIVFLEMFIDPVCSVVFEAEPSETDAMRRPPRNPNEPLFGGARLYLSFLQGAIVLCTSFALYAVAARSLADPNAARAVAFISLIAGNVGLVLVNRSWHVSVLRTLLRRNTMLWASIAVTALVLCLLMYFEPARLLFQFALPPATWLVVSVLAGLGVTFWFDALKTMSFIKKLR
jgi:Ca2+-transporting ATPase